MQEIKVTAEEVAKISQFADSEGQVGDFKLKANISKINQTQGLLQAQTAKNYFRPFLFEHIILTFKNAFESEPNRNSFLCYFCKNLPKMAVKTLGEYKVLFDLFVC